jgi:thiol-disulfide isomerase/thioredoxin
MKQLFLILLSISHLHAVAQKNIKVGHPAPPITVTDWIANVPVDINLANKFIVLEFWATWCSPCIEAVPHMNSLQAKFNRPDLYFVSITDESRQKVERFLKRVELKSIVVSDQNNKTQALFGDGVKGVVQLPLTVLINDKGDVSWMGLPFDLTESMIADFLSGKKVESGISSAVNVTLHTVESTAINNQDESIELLKNRDILYKLEFRKSASKSTQMTKVGTTFTYFAGVVFPELYSEVFGYNKNAVLVPEKIKSEYYDLIYKNVNGKKEDMLEVEKYILDALRLKKSVSLRKVKVYEASVSDIQLLEKTTDDFMSRSGTKDKVVFTGYTMRDFFKDLGKYTSEMIVMPNVIDGRYDFIIDITSMEDIIESLEKYGFKISAAEKSVEMIELKLNK